MGAVSMPLTVTGVLVMRRSRVRIPKAAPAQRPWRLSMGSPCKRARSMTADLSRVAVWPGSSGQVGQLALQERAFSGVPASVQGEFEVGAGFVVAVEASE